MTEEIARSLYQPIQNWKKQQILEALPPSLSCAHWKPISSEIPKTKDEIQQAFYTALETHPAGVTFSFSHDHYLTIGGGVQNCIGDEQQGLNESGWIYFHLCPNVPKPILADYDANAEQTMIASLNGVPFGAVRMSDLVALAGFLSGIGHAPVCIVHHLLGFAPEAILNVIAAAPGPRPVVWLHDLFTLCPSVHLLRNNATFCASPPIDSLACSICHAGKERSAHVSRIRRFFDETRPVVVAPSEVMLDFWQKHAPFQFEEARVIAPCSLLFDKQSAVEHQGNRPLKVAFLGAPVFHKGWFDFQALARSYTHDSRYSFYHFGWTMGASVPGIQHVPVSVTRDNRQAMVEAVSDAGIDVVINWSPCFESFSFTTYEAIAAGSFVVARRDAGNVWPAVAAVGEHRGIALGSEIELNALFASGEILELVKTADRRQGHLIFNNGSGAVLL